MKIGSLNAVGSDANQDSVRSEAAISLKRVDTSGRDSAMACQGFGPVFEDDADAYLTSAFLREDFLGISLILNSLCIPFASASLIHSGQYHSSKLSAVVLGGEYFFTQDSQ